MTTELPMLLETVRAAGATSSAGSAIATRAADDQPVRLAPGEL